MKTANKIALGLGVAALAALALWALKPQPVAVETAEVKRGAFEQTVSDDGKTRVRDRFIVSAPLAGRTERMRLKAGDAVTAGQVIAVLTPTAPALLDARAERELSERGGTTAAQHLRARAEVQKAEAQAAQARADRDRAAKLAGEGFVAPAARELSELALRTAERSFEAAKFAEHAAEHEAAQARAALSRYRAGDTGTRWEVKSPIAGRVLRVAQESEAEVALGAPLAEIADARRLEAVVEVLSQEAVSIQPGMAARIELGGGVAPLAARVQRIEPAAFTKVSALGVEEQRVNVVLDIVDNLERVQTIGDGFRIEAHIAVFRAEDAVTVPVGALFREGTGWAVFVADNERAVKRAVRTTRRNGVDAMVDEGLKPGERVVMYPSDALKDGARISARGAQ